MSQAFDRAFEHTLSLEGGFVDDPSDSGGATKYGITQRVARANGYRGSMRELDLEKAQVIAKQQYWDVLRLDDVADISAGLAGELFDTSFNMGPGTAGRFLQTALSALNRQQADFPDLVADGIVGPMTISALRTYMLIRGSAGARVLLRAMNCLQGAAYIDLSQRRQKDERFLFGWLLNRVDHA